MNGDGVGDFLAGSYSPAPGETAYVICGKHNLPREIDARSYIEDEGGGVMLLTTAGDYDIATPGDVDGDGYSDILLGFAAYCRSQGISFLIHGAADVPGILEIGEAPVDPGIARVVRILGEDVRAQAGAVGPAGDFNADGFDDSIIGAGIRPPVGDLNGDGYPDFSFVDADKLHAIYGLPRNDAYIRGEANGDAIVILTDAVFILEHLFQGGLAPSCLDAADTDDTGELNVTDGVYLLRHLFRGPRRRQHHTRIPVLIRRRMGSIADGRQSWRHSTIDLEGAAIVSFRVSIRTCTIRNGSSRNVRWRPRSRSFTS